MPTRAARAAEYRAVASRLERLAETEAMDDAPRRQLAETVRLLRALADGLGRDDALTL